MSYLCVTDEEAALLREQCTKAGIDPDPVLQWVEKLRIDEGLLELCLTGNAVVAGFDEEGPEFSLTDAGMKAAEKLVAEVQG